MPTSPLEAGDWTGGLSRWQLTGDKDVVNLIKVSQRDWGCTKHHAFLCSVITSVLKVSTIIIPSLHERKLKLWGYLTYPRTPRWRVQSWDLHGAWATPASHSDHLAAPPPPSLGDSTVHYLPELWDKEQEGQDGDTALGRGTEQSPVRNAAYGRSV